MHTSQWQAEQERDLLCHIEDEYRSKKGIFEMNFLRLGDLVINLNNVNTMELQTWDNRPCVRIAFSGDQIHRVYQDNLGVYDELVAWMKSQPQVHRDMEL